MKLPVLFLLPAFAVSVWAQTADESWAAIEKLRRGPGVPPPDAPDQVVRNARSHLAKQEQALEAFIAGFPADPRRHEAVIELAGVTADIGVSLSDRNRVEKALRDLAEVERDESAPSKARADAAYRRITTTMQTVNLAAAARPGETAIARNLIHDSAGNFASRYPEDRRAAQLLAVAATLFDDMPDRKRKILEQAALIAKDEATKRRISDDLKRLGWLGKTGDVSFQTIRGEDFSLAQNRGKVVLLVFWAAWSPPSVARLAKLAEEARDWPADRVTVATVSLDEKRNNCAETLRVLGIDRWPTACSGGMWEDPVARALAINGMPTVFVYDTEGKLRVLNARNDCTPLIRKLLSEAPARR